MKTILLAMFLIYAVVLTIWGFFIGKRQTTGEDFLLGGRSLNAALLLGTTLATVVGTGATMGAVGGAYQGGFTGMFFIIGEAIGLIILVLLFADARGKEFITFSEEVSYYYGGNKQIRAVVAIVIYLAEIGWLGAHLLGGSMYLSWITGIPLQTAKIISALAFGVYTFAGGYLAVVYTDAVQAIILSVGFLIVALKCVPLAGGWAHLKATLPPEFFTLGRAGVLTSLSLAISMWVSAIVTPTYRHRIYSGKDIGTVRRGMITAAVLYILFAVLPALIGMSARAMNPNLPKPDMAFPYLVTEALPLWLGALVLLAGLSATMSSGDSDAMAGATILQTDIYPAFFGKYPPKEKVKKYSQLAVMGTMILAYLLTVSATSVMGYITQMVSTIMTGLCVATFLGKYWPRATWQGGIAAMVVGSVVSLVLSKNAAFMTTWGNPVIPSLACSIAAEVIVSLLTPPTSISREEALKQLAEFRANLGG